MSVVCTHNTTQHTTQTQVQTHKHQHDVTNRIQTADNAYLHCGIGYRLSVSGCHFTAQPALFYYNDNKCATQSFGNALPVGTSCYIATGNGGSVYYTASCSDNGVMTLVTYSAAGCTAGGSNAVLEMSGYCNELYTTTHPNAIYMVASCGSYTSATPAHVHCCRHAVHWHQWLLWNRYRTKCCHGYVHRHR